MFPSLEPPTWGVYLILSTYCSSNILKSLPDQTSMTIIMADADNGVERFPHCRTSFPMTSTEMITSWRSPQVLTPHWSLLWCWHMRRWSKPTTADSALVTSETSEISETGRECRATLLMRRSGCTFKIFQEDHAQLHNLQSWILTTWIPLACNKSLNGFAFSRGKPCQGCVRSLSMSCSVPIAHASLLVPKCQNASC